MNKTALIIKREYLTRVRKKSFIILTLLTPLLMAAMVVIPVVIMTSGNKEVKRIAVVEQEGDLFRHTFHSTQYLKFDYLGNVSVDSLKRNFDKMGYYGLLVLTPKVSYIPSAAILFSKKQPPLEVVSYIENALEKEIEKRKLLSYNIRDLDKILKQVETNVKLQTIQITDSGEEKKTSTGVAMAIAYIGGLLIYMLTFMFGAMVMRGVIEEKTNRIVEVLISSVKPMQLMAGKIIGIALVGLTQFLLWIILTLVLVTGVTQLFLAPQAEKIAPPPESLFSSAPQASGTAASPSDLDLSRLLSGNEVFEALASVNWPLILGSFLLYFLGGYLLYASLFAAIGAAVDNETDTQQFMMPITIPLLIALFIAMGAFQNPDSPIAFWGSIIPFTSPVVMMARLPYGVPMWQLALSLALLYLTFVGTIWVAARIYRTGILMYGKKVSWKELWKWLRYRNY